MITYREGDLLTSGCAVIFHQVNCQGVMGSGIAKQIREQFPQAYIDYRKRFENNKDSAKRFLGEIDIVNPWHIPMIVNMYSQYHYIPRNICHTNYDAFRGCLRKFKASEIGKSCAYYHYTIGFPDHIGCGLAGGDWKVVQGILEEEFAEDCWKVEIWKK